MRPADPDNRFCDQVDWFDNHGGRRFCFDRPCSFYSFYCQNSPENRFYDHDSGHDRDFYDHSGRSSDCLDCDRDPDPGLCDRFDYCESYDYHCRDLFGHDDRRADCYDHDDGHVRCFFGQNGCRSIGCFGFDQKHFDWVAPIVDSDVVGQFCFA